MENARLEVGIGDLVEAAHVPFKEVYQGRYTKGREPLIPATPGVRNTARYSLCQVVTIRVARLLHKRFKIDPEDMKELLDRLWFAQPEELLAEFKRGNTNLILIGRKASNEFFPPSAVNTFDAELKRMGFRTTPVVGVSLEREFERCVEMLLVPAETN
ncbi:hypothetical protein [Gemmata sp.]|uniref:hypothetical protein n=1 Tax=Gemmata sp. TaxID=1914242 RepID=UPI003F6FF2A2